MNISRLLHLLPVVLLLAACQPASEGAGKEYDPLESFNRGMYQVHDGLDTVIIKPTVTAYRFVVPEYGRDRVDNFFTNLSEPWTLANAILQGDVHNSFATFWRFMLNSSVGIGGLFDFAGMHGGLPRQEEDFGQTLAVWGIPSGPYLFIPALGPTSMRDLPGRVLEWFFDPFDYYANSWEFEWARTGGEALVAADNTRDVIDNINETSFDPYASVRSLYIQRRAAQVENRNAK